MDLDQILEDVAAGRLTVADARSQLAHSGIAELGFARVDTDRLRRRGLPEVLFCAGKTAEQVVAIARTMVEAGQNVLGTRVEQALFDQVAPELPDVVYHAAASCLTIDTHPLPGPVGAVLVVTAGTSDIPVAEEAALVAERMGAGVERLFDVGVAGLHRLLPHVAALRRARAVVVVAGMEGALPSVVGGLVDVPVIAVPTSVGYGLNLQGATALLAMLNSCVPGVTVVNVDNGFGAGVAAAMINRLPEREEEGASP